MKKKYLILPLSIIWVTNMYSADSALGLFARHFLPLLQEIQNSDNNNSSSKETKRQWLNYFTNNTNNNYQLGSIKQLPKFPVIQQQHRHCQKKRTKKKSTVVNKNKKPWLLVHITRSPHEL